MLMTSIRMNVLPEKQKELAQAITSLVQSIIKEKGCRRCDFCRGLENENEFCLFGEWESEEDFVKHTQSKIFEVLMGAMSLLKNPQELKIYANLSALEANEAWKIYSNFK